MWTAQPNVGGLDELLPPRNPQTGLSSSGQLRLRTSARISAEEAQGAVARHPSVLRRGGVRQVGSNPTPPHPPGAATSKSLRMKPVGKPDAGNPHVRFDERGRETESCLALRHRRSGESRRQQLPLQATATAPVLDSTQMPAATPDRPAPASLRVAPARRTPHVNCQLYCSSEALPSSS